jgi:hypothetical protein
MRHYQDFLKHAWGYPYSVRESCGDSTAQLCADFIELAQSPRTSP